MQQSDKRRDKIKRNKGVNKHSDLDKESSDINNNTIIAKVVIKWFKYMEKKPFIVLFCFVLFVGGVVWLADNPCTVQCLFRVFCFVSAMD